MKSVVLWLTGTSAATLLFLGAAARLDAQDPTRIAPQHYQVLLDNDQVRVLQFSLRPGERAPRHSHPAHLTYALTNYEVKIDQADGYPQIEVRNPGDLNWSGPAQHAVENIGQVDAMALIIELKEPDRRIAVNAVFAGGPVRRALFGPRLVEVQVEKRHHLMITPDQVKWLDNNPSLPAGTKMAILDGDPAKTGPFTVRLFAPAGTKVAPHWHPAHEQITVLSGNVHMGMGDVFDKSKTKKYPAGSFLVMPAESRHFAWMEEDTVIQVHAMGPWAMTYVNPADDPRKK